MGIATPTVVLVAGVIEFSSIGGPDGYDGVGLGLGVGLLLGVVPLPAPPVPALVPATGDVCWLAPDVVVLPL